MNGIEPAIKLSWGKGWAWTLGLGSHCYRTRVRVGFGRLLICLPGYVLARGYLL